MTAFRGFIAELALVLALAAGLGHFTRAEAGVITWSGNTWDHSAFGGSAASAGWQAGMQGGTTTDGAGVTMTMQHTRFGTAAAGAGNMNLQAFGGLGSYLMWSATNDYTGGNANNAPKNYGTVTLAFNTTVAVTGFGLRDVDDGTGTSWQDFVSVSASNGGTNVGVTYNRSDTTNQQLSTYRGMSGVLGVNDVNRNNDPIADLGFTFAGGLTTMTITYLQGPDGSDATLHYVFLMNLTVTPVPEASTLTLVGLAGAFGGFVHWRRKRRSAV